MRHALEILSELATKDPYAVAMALGNLMSTLYSSNDVCFDEHDLVDVKF